MPINRKAFLPRNSRPVKDNQSTLQEILQALETISPTEKKSESKLQDLIKRNNQLTNDIEIRSYIARIPYIFSTPSEEEQKHYSVKVEEAKNFIKIRIVHLLDHNSDIANTNLEDIILSADIMQDVSSIRDMLESHEKFEDYGVVLPTGFLFGGPPGVGKTELARRLSKISGTNFISIRMSDILHGIVGESEKAITEVFTKARNQNITNGKPSLIFIDEADKLLGKRENQQHSLVQHFLSLVDGFYKNKDITVILSTNKEESIDPGVLSRMAKKIKFNLPTLEEIPKIFKVHLLKASNETIKQKYETFYTQNESSLKDIFAKLHDLKASGRDIKNITQSAKTDFMLRHVKNNDESMTIADIEYAVGKTLSEKSK